MNVPVIAMAMAAGISIDAALTHGLVGATRRPRDPVRIAFAIQAAAVAAGALAAIAAIYAEGTPQTHVAVMKWAFFPAGVAWAVATLWMVAFYTGVRPIRWLAAVGAGFGAVLVLDLVLPYGLLHGRLSMASPKPHPLNLLADAVLLAAFALMFYMAWRVHRRGERGKAWMIAAVLLIFLTATAMDALEAYGVMAELYFTQISFAVLVVAVSLRLRHESMRDEAELRVYRTHLEAVVNERVKELDAANEQLALEVRERLATEESLRRRVAELNALQRVSRTLADRSDLGAALDQATPEIAALFTARYARIDLAQDGEVSCADQDGQDCPPAVTEGAGCVLVVPLAARGSPSGSISIGRHPDEPFSDEERRLAQTVADDVAAAVDNERLHERQTRQAAEEERQRLARDLHDAVTQTIYSAALIAEALPAAWERDPAAGLHNLTRLRRLVRAALAEMRTLLFELRPAALEAAPLEALLARLGDALAGQIQAPVDVQTDGGVAVPSDVKLVLYRVAQEAFSNVAKHARATRVGIDLHANDDGDLALIIYDDGNGFDPSSVAHDRMGLRIMRERADRVGASLSIDSEPGGGTTITVIWQDQALAQAAQKTGAS